MADRPPDTETIIRDLGLQILKHENLLNLLFSLGDRLREPTSELDAVRGSADALGEVIRPHKLAFFSTPDPETMEHRTLKRSWSHADAAFPDSLELPENEAQDSLAVVDLAGYGRHLVYWHLPTRGVRWALLVSPGEGEYYHAIVSSSVRLFGNCLAGISAVRTASRLGALEGAFERLLEEHKLTLSGEIENWREQRIALHQELKKLDQRLAAESVPPPNTRKQWVEGISDALQRMDKSIRQLRDTVKGIRPEFLGVRQQFEAEQDELLSEILPGEADVESGLPFPHGIWVTTKPTVLAEALRLFEGVLRELSAQEKQAASVAEPESAPQPGTSRKIARGPAGNLRIDLIANTGGLDETERKELADRLTKLVDPESWPTVKFRLARPLALQGVLAYLKRLRIDVAARPDGLSLTLSKDIVHFAEQNTGV